MMGGGGMSGGGAMMGGGMSGGGMGGGMGMGMGGGMGGAGGGGGGMGGGAGGDDCEDCVDLKVTTQKVTVPCTRNTYKSYTVKVPRVVREKIPRTVKYVDMEKRTKQVPYTVNKCETRYRNDRPNLQSPRHPQHHPDGVG